MAWQVVYICTHMNMHRKAIILQKSNATFDWVTVSAADICFSAISTIKLFNSTVLYNYAQHKVIIHLLNPWQNNCWYLAWCFTNTVTKWFSDALVYKKWSLLIWHMQLPPHQDNQSSTTNRISFIWSKLWPSPILYAQLLTYMLWEQQCSSTG